MHLQKLRGLQLELRSKNLQNEQLKLEVLRWRKQCSLMRLKLASAREKVQLHESNLDLLSQREQRLSSDAASLKGQLASAVQQLTDMTAAKAQVQAESAKFQVRAAIFATVPGRY
jgi:chromosome segregation ATPase